MGILDEIASAYGEITSLFALIDAIQVFTTYLPLANQFTAGQISPEGFTLEMIAMFVILPLIQSVIIGWIAHKLGISRLIRKLI